MIITDSFRNAILSNDVTGLRIMMKDSLLVDPSFSGFEEMRSLAAGVPGLFDPHDGREFESNKSLWNDDYMNKLMVQVVGNFSHERINHLKEVVRVLRPISKPSQPSPLNEGEPRREAPRRSYQEQKRHDEREGRIIRKEVVVGGVAGGVVTGIVIAVAGGSATAVAVGAVVGALAVGLVVAKVTD